MNYTWDGRLQRYRDAETGRMVKSSTVVSLIEKNIAQKEKSLQENLTKLLTGKQDPITFQVETARTIKYLHTQQYLVAMGGFKDTRTEDYLAIARDLKSTHHPALRQLMLEMQNGKLTGAQIKQRVSGFALASRSSYELGRRRSAQKYGFAWARRFLGAIATEHCADCPTYAAMGVVPIMSVVLPGQQCDCRYNCKCSVRYYKSRDEANRPVRR